MKNLKKIIQILILHFIALDVYAVDGVVEINQVCATQTGCFSTDIAGFPVFIDGTAGRSYRLTSDLVVPVGGNISGIVIGVNSMTLDLNGFAIIRQGCGNLDSCNPVSVSGIGISILNTGTNPLDGVTIKNGSVIGMGIGIYSLSDGTIIRNMRIIKNPREGIVVQDYAHVLNSHISQNGSTGIISGISAGSHALIINNQVNNNGGVGIAVVDNSLISDNVSANNGSSGVHSQLNNKIQGNTITNNGQRGIYARGFSLITNNLIDGNQLDGINIEYGKVDGNIITNNGLIGLRFVQVHGTYRDNYFRDNGGANVQNGINNLGQNFCDTNTTCP